MKKFVFIILLMISAIFLLATFALAQTGQTGYEPMVPIPGAGEITDISDYIKALYLFGLAIVGVIAMLFIIIGGIRYMAAAGNEAGISEAKSQITSAILGLVLVLTSWLILHTINPELTSLKKLTVDKPAEFWSSECVNGECKVYEKPGRLECNPLDINACEYVVFRCDQDNICRKETVSGPGVPNECSETELNKPCEEKNWRCCNIINGKEICSDCMTEDACQDECSRMNLGAIQGWECKNRPSECR